MGCGWTSLQNIDIVRSWEILLLAMLVASMHIPLSDLLAFEMRCVDVLHCAAPFPSQ